MLALLALTSSFNAFLAFLHFYGVFWGVFRLSEMYTLWGIKKYENIPGSSIFNMKLHFLHFCSEKMPKRLSLKSITRCWGMSTNR